MNENERTTIETVGKKDGQIVRLRYEHDDDLPLPQVKVVGDGEFSGRQCDLWEMDVATLASGPMEFRGLSLLANDPVRVLAAMVAFYDEPPEEKIDDPEGFFECDPNVVY